jgi:hypothetical protein
MYLTPLFSFDTFIFLAEGGGERRGHEGELLGHLAHMLRRGGRLALRIDVNKELL